MVTVGMPMPIEFDVAPSQTPDATEPICLVSYEVTKILLAGEPSERPGFWKIYRQTLEYNRVTEYQNYRLNLCKDLLEPIRPMLDRAWYFRDCRLQN